MQTGEKANTVWRATRPDDYPPGSLGHSDTSARNGIYIEAEDPFDAARQLAKRFPGVNFELEYWRPATPHLRVVK